MPKGYEKIKLSLRKAHPDWSDERVESTASKIFNKRKKVTGDTGGKGRK